jgi:hypothetical protein
MKSHIRQWCRYTQNTDCGKVSLSNIVFDVTDRVLPFAVVREFLRDVARLWSQRGATQPGETLLREVAVAGGSKYHGRRSTPLPGAPQCSTVMLASEFQRRYVALRRLGWNDCGDYVPESRLRLLERRLTGRLRSRMLPAQGRVGWVTTSDALAALRHVALADDHASEVRSSLGLAHYVSQVQLIELEYPKQTFASAELWRPTFIEGSPRPYYRSFRDANGWGRAVNLRTGRPGVAEAVHAPLPLTDAFRLRYLGWLQDMHNSLTFSRLWQEAPQPWQTHHIRTLENIVK